MPDIHDLGGHAEHFAPIQRETDEPVFHERWEARVAGMMAVVWAMLGKTTDRFRYDIERLPAQKYFSSYWARWLAALESELHSEGYLADGELDAKISGRPRVGAGAGGSRVRLRLVAVVFRMLTRPTLPRWVCAFVLPRVFGEARRTRRPAMFAVGDAVRVRPRRGGHTRQPGYVTGKTGVVTEHHGAGLFPDAQAFGRRVPPQHVYTVAFDGRELWGTDGAQEAAEVRVELYEPYLERA